jgi:hypothetical protein
MRSYPHMPTIDCRPPPASDGYREHIPYRRHGSTGWSLPLREDLILKPWARALGYVVEHRDGNWHNSASFNSENSTVWTASDGWQARDTSHGPTPPRHTCQGPRRVYGHRAYSLFTALLREAPLLLEHA